MTSTPDPTAFPGTGGNTAQAGGFTFDPTAIMNAGLSGVTKGAANKQILAPVNPGSSTYQKVSVADWVKSILNGGGLSLLYSFVPDLQRASYLSENPGADGNFNPRQIIAALVEAGGDASDAGKPVLDWITSVGQTAQASRQQGGNTKFVRSGNVNEGLTSPDVVQRIGDAVGQQLLGRRLHPDEVAAITSVIQSQEGSKASADVAAAQSGAAQYAMAAQGGALMNGGSLQDFMSAISGEESGGNSSAVNKDTGAAGTFQIMPGNWSQWSADAGMPGAPFTPQNQQIVAAQKMQEYYNQFHSWQAVAVAWYAGPQTAAQYVADPTNPAWDKPQYSNGNQYPSINSYVGTVIGKMGGVPTSSSGGGTQTVGSPYSFQTPTGTVNVLAPQLTTYMNPDDPESAAEAWIRQNRPTEYQANNLFNGFQILDQAMREGVATKAAQPMNTGGSL